MLYQLVTCRSFVTLGRYFVNFERNIHVQRTLFGTHYDTLKLPRNCTSKEVRDSFIKLSKQCHPDRNRSDPDTHAKFVKLNEAYSVLSRPHKRQAYDLTLKPLSSERYRRAYGDSTYDVYTTAYRQRVVWKDESFWEYKDKSTHGDFNQSGDYYGIRGLKRVPNGWIAILCVIVAVIGVWIQVLLIKYSTTFNRRALDERSQQTSKILSDVQDQARRNGNEVQLEILRQRYNMSQSSNRTPITSDDKSTTTTESKNSYSHDTVGSSNIVIPDVDFYSKASLGYLGDMPQRIENDVRLVPEENSLTPELHNISRNKIMENDVSNQIFPKPVIFDTPKIVAEQNLSELVFANESNSVENKSKTF